MSEGIKSDWGRKNYALSFNIIGLMSLLDNLTVVVPIIISIVRYPLTSGNQKINEINKIT